MKFFLPLICILLSAAADAQEFIWWEGESASEHNFPKSGAFKAYEEEERNKLSGGDWLQTDRSGGCTARWDLKIRKDGRYSFWTRKFWKHGPFQWRFNNGGWKACGGDCGLADSVELRKHVCANWVFLGEIDLRSGDNRLEIRMEPDAAAAAFDCFLLIEGPFTPRGKMRPGEKYNRAPEGWFAFEPDDDPFSPDSPIDLSFLNHSKAGDRGFLRADGASLRFEKDPGPVKFWAVNAGPGTVELDKESIVSLAKLLAKRGVNMVRIHSTVFDKDSADPSLVDRRYLDKLHFFVSAMKEQGIYIKLSFYFPLWFDIRPGYGIPGYGNERKTPFALLFFHPRMQEIYKSWARVLLTEKNPYTGLSLADDPAVGIVEIVNEDNYFFWTFKPYETVPAECIRILEEKFGQWAKKRYGSLEKALEAWGGMEVKGDNLKEGRAGIYAAGLLTGAEWAVTQRNRQRASDTAEFLTEQLRGFYREISDYFRKSLGVKCALTASNWTTADQKLLGPLDKYANSACDIMDRHGYYEAPMKKERSWTISLNDCYLDSSALLAPENIPAQEIRFAGKPHIISETNWCFPNRFRTEGVYLLSAYGSLQGGDGIFLFSLGSAGWQLENSIWAVTTPAILGQFPVAALMFRKGYVAEPRPIMVDSEKLADLYQLKGAAVYGGSSADSVRKADLEGPGEDGSGKVESYDQLSTYVGPVELNVSEAGGKSTAANTVGCIDRAKKVVTSITKELLLDYGKGILSVNAPCVQGAAGFLSKGSRMKFADFAFESPLEYGAIFAISLDGKPLRESSKILVQAMSEETNYGWITQPQMEKPGDKPVKMRKIVSIGDFPIIVKRLEGVVALSRPDAASLEIHSLDFNGYRKKKIKSASPSEASFSLLPDCIYYLIEK